MREAATNNRVLGNVIGTKKDGVGALGNSGSGVSVSIFGRGSLRSAPENTFAVRFFENPSGGNEGKTIVAQRSVTTNADGIGSFSLTLEDAKRVPVGKAITARATNDNGGTSEFSAPRKVVRQ